MTPIEKLISKPVCFKLDVIVLTNLYLDIN